VPAEFRDNPLERFEMEARLSKGYDAWIVEELYYHPVFDLPKRWYYQVKENLILISLTSTLAFYSERVLSLIRGRFC
jgi:hypothetical protein